MSLKTYLEDASIHDPCGGTRRFIPCGALEAILTESLVRSELQECFSDGLPPEETSRIVALVCHSDTKPLQRSLRKVFSTLALIGLGSYITQFIEHDISDADLPLLHSADSFRIYTSENDGKSSGALLANQGTELTVLEFTRSWGPVASDAFFSEQWTFLAPVFEGTSKKINHYMLSSHHILPIVSHRGPVDRVIGTAVSGSAQMIGGFASVSSVGLHHQHCHFQGERTKMFAFKMLPPAGRSQFNQEARVLRAIRSLEDDHLVSLLATFEIPSVGFFLIFPCAAGDLELLWKTTPVLSSSRHDILQWMARESVNIVVALAKVHNLSTAESGHNTRSPSTSRHGDLTAANILWYPAEEGLEHSRLVIADFGSAVIDEPLPGDSTQAAMTYRAPECGVGGSRVTSASDMWPLGCLFLEFITWFIQGWDAVEISFTEARLARDDSGLLCDTFFALVNGKAQVKPQVHLWVESLSRQPGCPRYLSDFLALISSHLLQIDPLQRMSANRLSQELKKMHDELKASPSYWKSQDKDTSRRPRKSACQ